MNHVSPPEFPMALGVSSVYAERSAHCSQEQPLVSAAPPSLPLSTFLLPLRPQHIGLLHDSGLSDETIATRGYKTATFKNALTEAGFSPGQARNVPALLIPIYDVDGNLALWQMRPDVAPVFDGKAVKYMTPAGAKLCLDVPLSVQPFLTDVSIPLWITEGSKKVDAAIQHGLCCIGALGVTGWMRDKLPLSDWKKIALDGRTIILAFDADLRRKIEVWRALQALKSFLEGQGARVLIVYLPDDAADPSKKIGLDDYLLHHSVEELKALASPDLCPAPSTGSGKPRTELERLRKDGLTKKLQGIADVHPHGGIQYSKDVTEAEIKKAAKSLDFFYGRIDDLKKWDMIDTWMAVADKIEYRQRQAWKDAHFGRFSKQIGNWITAVGERFAKNTDNCRRSHLPVWLHEFIKDLTIEQQEIIFDTFESAEGGRMPQSKVTAMIETLTGPQPQRDKGRKTDSSHGDSNINGGHWKRCAQIWDEDLAEMELRFAHELGPKQARQELVDFIVSRIGNAEDSRNRWAGMDVLDAPAQEADSCENGENEIESFTTVKDSIFNAANFPPNMEGGEEVPPIQSAECLSDEETEVDPQPCAAPAEHAPGDVRPDADGCTDEEPSAYQAQQLALMQFMSKTVNVPLSEMSYEEAAMLNLLCSGEQQRAAWAEIAALKELGCRLPDQYVQELNRIVRRMIRKGNAAPDTRPAVRPEVPPALSILERAAAPAEHAPRRLASVSDVLAGSPALSALSAQSEHEAVVSALLSAPPSDPFPLDFAPVVDACADEPFCEHVADVEPDPEEVQEPLADVAPILALLGDSDSIEAANAIVRDAATRTFTPGSAAHALHADVSLLLRFHAERIPYAPCWLAELRQRVYRNARRILGVDPLPSVAPGDLCLFPTDAPQERAVTGTMGAFA